MAKTAKSSSGRKGRKNNQNQKETFAKLASTYNKRFSHKRLYSLSLIGEITNQYVW
jgi:hypothetical protein